MNEMKEGRFHTVMNKIYISVKELISALAIADEVEKVSSLF